MAADVKRRIRPVVMTFNTMSCCTVQRGPCKVLICFDVPVESGFRCRKCFHTRGQEPGAEWRMLP